MNIFYLDRDPAKCAAMHCDKHVVKMILEYAQLLSTAHRVLDGDQNADSQGFYKATHKNHPSAVWVRESWAHYVKLHKKRKSPFSEKSFGMSIENIKVALNTGRDNEEIKKYTIHS